MRGGIAADRRRADIRFLVEQGDQHRRVVAFEERDLQHAQRHATQPLALEPHLPVIVGDQEACEVASRRRAVVLPHRARAEHAVRTADAPFRSDQHRHDAGRAEPVAGRPDDQSLDRSGHVEPLRAAETPHQQILRLTGALDERGQRRAARDHPFDVRATVAPRRPSGDAQPVHAIVVDRQARRRREAGEQFLVAVVGADQPSGAIGDRHRIRARRRQRTRDAPVGFAILVTRDREQSPRRDHAAGDHQPRGHEGTGDREAADQPEHDRRRRHAATAGDQRGAAGAMLVGDCRKAGHHRKS